MKGRGRREIKKKYKVANSYIRLEPARVAELLAPFGVPGEPQLISQIIEYTHLLCKWGDRVNLTSIREPEEIIERHFGESLFAAYRLPILGGRLADVGSGAGFPGLALKLAVSGLDVHLIEPVKKKAAFLSEAIRTLGLGGAKVHAWRHQDRPDTRELGGNLDWITARALGEYDSLLEWASRNLADGGRVVLWLGLDDTSHLSKAKGWKWAEPILLPRSQGRCILMGKPQTVTR